MTTTAHAIRTQAVQDHAERLRLIDATPMPYTERQARIRESEARLGRDVAAAAARETLDGLKVDLSAATIVETDETPILANGSRVSFDARNVQTGA